MNLAELDSDKLLAAFRGLLLSKGVLAEEELSRSSAAMDAASPARGAAVVAKAWADPGYRARLLDNATPAVEELGIYLTGAPPLGVLENTPEVHNIIVCTLCSCYPRMLLGYPPLWYKSAGYRSRAVRDPRGLLREEWGTIIPAETKVRVLDSTADFRWMVLPRRPRGTEGWSEEKLAGLVRETDLIGVTVLPEKV
jgi:hypothetical protein